MSITAIIVVAVIGLLALAALAVYLLRRPRKLRTDYFAVKWHQLQDMLADKEKWPEAIVLADNLLDEALKKRRFKGRSMGERLVAAQRLLSDNDGAWYGHKLRKKLELEPELKLRRQNVKDALLGLRQALKDLGAIK